MPQVIFVNGAQIVGHDVPLDGVMVRCRSIEHLPGNQLEPGVPEREWSDAALLSTYTDPAVGFALTAAVMSLAPNEPWNSITSVVVRRNVVANGLPIRSLEYEVFRVDLDAELEALSHE